MALVELRGVPVVAGAREFLHQPHSRDAMWRVIVLVSPGGTLSKVRSDVFGDDRHLSFSTID